ncbi:MAG TPA: MarR family transcriptional regulator [Streptosporangiaceae bacterium]|nr:MarR family transcriptional regulator [Streptosporangiaceae bacterium]
MTEDDAARTARELRLILGSLVRRVRSSDQELPLAQAGVLGYLDREGPMTTSDLAAVQHVRHQSMARTVAQLTGAGLVEPGPHPTDGRKVLLRITTAGRAAVGQRRDRRAGWLAEAISTRLTPAEQQALADVLPLLGRLAAH